MKKNNVEKKSFSKIDKIKSLFKNKYVIIGTIVIVVISIVVAIIMIVNARKREIFSLNSIFNVYPEEVKELYSNMVSVSCYGDLHFDIKKEDGEVNVDKLGDNYLLDYVFSHIDKNNGLDNEVTKSMFSKNIDNLIYGDLGLIDKIKDYKYDDGFYSFKDDKLVKNNGTCSSDVKYVSFLFGYSYGTQILSVDVNMGYLKDDVLYDLNNKKLGKYDGDIVKLRKLYSDVPYYRYNFIKSDGYYKLKSVQLYNREQLKK